MRAGERRVLLGLCAQMRYSPQSIIVLYADKVLVVFKRYTVM
jgi:hypothetical protein